MRRLDTCARYVCAFITFTFLTICFSADTFAQSSFATLEAHRGDVTVVRLGNEMTPSMGMELERNDIVVTRMGSSVVRFSTDGSQLRIGPNSRVQINETAGERGIEVFFGKLWARIVAWRERPVRFKTGATIAAVRGTELAIDFDEETTLLSVLEGEVMTENPAGSLTVGGGQSAMVAPGQAPALRVLARPQDAVQWALYYLPVIYATPDEIGERENWQRAVRSSMEAFWSGDLETALDRIEEISDAAVRDPRFFNYRASLRLAASVVDEAAADIERALELKPNDSDALALQTIVAVVRNEKEEALAAADRAVASDRRSATALIAKSYAQQAVFDLEGARASLEQAVGLEAANALAWARLAELHLSFGDLGDALEAAREAVDREPNMTRAQTVLGYAYLTQVRTGDAREAFEKAIELDEGDPIPRLGLGLAMIRDGGLDEGTREIEVAASLDPGNGLLRSYLGKAYFEAKRIGLDDREYTLAKELDPLDPTPWFYDAIAKQTTNQPVEALRDMEKAIELNDNRAVYRSKLLLDADLAARSASQGRIYSDLGFQNLALVEGWSSVNTDPTNFSAHRLLADSYAALPRHEIARVSELLQSQLLQPLNTTPIQPRLGESNLFLISAGGPGSLSFNEFNPLFNRNGVNLQATGLFGTDSLWSGEGIVAGIYEKVSFSAGYTGFQTDGWRTNADQKDKIGNAFVQVELSPKTSIQAEYRYRDLETGDLQQRFFADDFKPGQADELDRSTYRVGGRHSFAPGSILLVSATAQGADGRSFTDEFLGPGTFQEGKTSEDDYGVEVQHLFRSRRLNITSGAGYFNVDGEIRLRLALPGGPPSGPPGGPPSGPPSGPPGGPPAIIVQEFPPIPNKFDHVDLYGYANLKPLTNVTVTVGGSFDRMTGDIPGGDVDQFNPKVGLTWSPVPGTTVRGAAFRMLKRTLVTDQTLEPTQVAGFNQFFDDSFVTDGWRYGGALDQKLGRDAYAGGEFSKRDLEFPFLLGPEVAEAQWDEWLGRAYFFVTPHRWLALRAQYVYERFERVQDQPLGFSELDTHRVPLGVGFFHPSGLSASFTVTYWNQEGQFVQGPGFVPGSSQFWLVDAAASYRLPKRYGFIAFGATNLLDKEFEYFEVNVFNPTIVPKRSVFVRITLAVP
jgi:tetratricopeptide (TPR) repeat protein